MKRIADESVVVLGSEILKLARELISVSWREFDDGKRRWTRDNGEFLWHIVEIEGPGIPLYRISLLIDSTAETYKYKRQVKTLKEAQNIADRYTDVLKDDVASVDLSRNFVRD